MRHRKRNRSNILKMQKHVNFYFEWYRHLSMIFSIVIPPSPSNHHQNQWNYIIVKVFLWGIQPDTSLLHCFLFWRPLEETNNVSYYIILYINWLTRLSFNMERYNEINCFLICLFISLFSLKSSFLTIRTQKWFILFRKK